MKIVLDTDVFISGVFFSGPPYQILKSWHDKKVQFVVSPEILTEYLRVGEILTNQFPKIEIQQIIDLLITNAELIVPDSLPDSVCIDPDDDKFLACAISGKAKLIISGDKHLLKVTQYRGIKIISPRKFIDEYISKNK